MSSWPQGLSTRRVSTANSSRLLRFGDEKVSPMRAILCREPLRMCGHELLGEAELLRRVHGQPRALVPVPREAPLGGELRERGALVVAALGEAGERLLVENVDPDVDPVRQRRRLLEAGDVVACVEVDDPERRLEPRQG